MSCWNQCDTLPPDLAGQTADKQDKKNWHVHGIMQNSVAYLKYLNKYALTTIVSANVKYVNTFVVNAYLFKYFKYAKG